MWCAWEDFLLFTPVRRRSWHCSVSVVVFSVLFSGCLLKKISVPLACHYETECVEQGSYVDGVITGVHAGLHMLGLENNISRKSRKKVSSDDSGWFC